MLEMPVSVRALIISVERPYRARSVRVLPAYAGMGHDRLAGAWCFPRTRGRSQLLDIQREAAEVLPAHINRHPESCGVGLRLHQGGTEQGRDNG